MTSGVPKFKSSGSCAVMPDPSLELSPNGGPRGTSRRYAVHFRRPGPRTPPSASAWPKRLTCSATMLAVRPLSRFPELKPTVARWLLAEWPHWYGEGGPGNLASDVEAFARSEACLPVGFVVFLSEEPVGFGALKQESIPGHEHLSPWAASGFVLPHCRRKGIGVQLLQAIVVHAQAQGVPCVYCGTSTAASLLQRAGWHLLEHTSHAGKPLSIFRSGA